VGDDALFIHPHDQIPETFPKFSAASPNAQLFLHLHLYLQLLGKKGEGAFTS
jgi:hypothetical protein